VSNSREKKSKFSNSSRESQIGRVRCYATFRWSSLLLLKCMLSWGTLAMYATGVGFKPLPLHQRFCVQLSIFLVIILCCIRCLND